MFASKSPVGDISVVTLIRTDTTLDHSQKAEKVCIFVIAMFLNDHNECFSCIFKSMVGTLAICASKKVFILLRAFCNFGFS